MVVSELVVFSCVLTIWGWMGATAAVAKHRERPLNHILLTWEKIKFQNLKYSFLLNVYHFYTIMMSWSIISQGLSVIFKWIQHLDFHIVVRNVNALFRESFLKEVNTEQVWRIWFVGDATVNFQEKHRLYSRTLSSSVFTAWCHLCNFNLCASCYLPSLLLSSPRMCHSSNTYSQARKEWIRSC